MIVAFVADFLSEQACRNLAEYVTGKYRDVTASITVGTGENDEALGHAVATRLEQKEVDAAVLVSLTGSSLQMAANESEVVRVATIYNADIATEAVLIHHANACEVSITTPESDNRAAVDAFLSTLKIAI